MAALNELIDKINYHNERYYNEDNPYQKDLKQTDGLKYAGMNADYTV